MLQLIRPSYRAELERAESSRGKLSLYHNGQGHNGESSLVTLVHSYSILESAVTGAIPQPVYSPSKAIKRIDEIYYPKTGEGEFEKNLAYLLLRENPGFFQINGKNSFIPLTAEDLRKISKTFYKGNNTRLLTTEEEVSLFKSLNYYKACFNSLAEDILDLNLQSGDFQKIRELINTYNLARSIRETIAAENIWLIKAMSRGREDILYSEECSEEGMLSLMNSVNSFDCSRGVKFSTYVCAAIKRRFCRGLEKASKNKSRFLGDCGESCTVHEDAAVQEHIDRLRKEEADLQLDLLNHILSKDLVPWTERERRLIQYRFFEETTPTLKEVSKLLGVNKSRAGQVQKRAINKLAAIFQEEYAARYESKPPANFPIKSV